MELSGKTILVISPQGWGRMMVSKHHYAAALAERGNRVYFLNPPDNDHWNVGDYRKRITCSPVPGHPGLQLIDHRLYFPYRLKFHARPLFRALMKKQIRDILRVIGRPVDILWSFDLGNLTPLGDFPAGPLRVFHPVDEPGDAIAIEAGRDAAFIFSVTREILAKYAQFGIPSFFINHGITDAFANLAGHEPGPGPVKAGLSGNLLRGDLDRRTLLGIVRENPAAEFHFFGSYRLDQANLAGGDDPATVEFIGALAAQPNVVLHGALGTGDLAQALEKMDVLLICYDLARDQSRGTNYHKVMEYLSTGNVIVSNNITTYDDGQHLVNMISSRSDNAALPALFRETAKALDRWNAPAERARRMAFARRHTYRHQLDEIGKILGGASVSGEKKDLNTIARS